MSALPGIATLAIVIVAAGLLTWGLIRLDERIDRLDARITAEARRRHPSQRREGDRG